MACSFFRASSMTLCQTQGRRPQSSTAEWRTVILRPSQCLLQTEHHPCQGITETPACLSIQIAMLLLITGSDISGICPCSKASASCIHIPLGPCVRDIPVWLFREVLEGEPSAPGFPGEKYRIAFSPGSQHLAQLSAFSLHQYWSLSPMSKTRHSTKSCEPGNTPLLGCVPSD